MSKGSQFHALSSFSDRPGKRSVSTKSHYIPIDCTPIDGIPIAYIPVGSIPCLTH